MCVHTEKSTYTGKFPENVRPGYRLDGVDRSNGFEKAMFLRRAEKVAIKEVAYKWSTEDM